MTTAEVQDVARRLREDFGFYAPTCLKIVATSGKLVAFEPKPAQLRLEAVAARQEAEGRPVRIIVPKARKEGVSTWAVGRTVQRVTQRENHNAVCVAQDGSTASELLGMATLMHANLPDSEQFAVKPPIANRRRHKELAFGNPARNTQASGDMGLNSRLTVDTAKEFEAGRGFTYHSVHASEPAFWDDTKRKLTSLLNAVPDDPGTMVILESTSNGHNHWRTLCYQAQDGENDFELVFLAWFEEPQYVRPFISDTERREFEERVGSGPYGAEEHDLIEIHGCSLEQLNWRRWKIANSCQGDLRIFHQEFPSTLDQSFGSTGNSVFNADHILVARKVVEAEATPLLGTLGATDHTIFQARFGSVKIPQAPKWQPTAAGPWRTWMPVEDGKLVIPADGQYVIGGDPAGDEQTLDADTLAMHAAQVIDHRTGRQVAELEMQGDPDMFAEQIFLAALLFNRAWVAVETTGGYGLSVNRRIHKDWRHPFVYRRRSADSTRADSDEQHRFGFDTNRATRQMLIDGAVEMLREGSHGIRSVPLIRQFSTFIKDNRGKPVPAPGERADLLFSWMIAEHVRQELPIRHGAEAGRVISTSTHRVRYTRAGW